MGTLAAERAARAELRAARTNLQDVEVRAGLRRRAPRWRMWAAILVAVPAVALAVWSLTSWAGAASTPTDEEYREAAIARVTPLLSPDHRDPDRSKAILAMSTDPFYDEFAQSADSYTRFIRARGTVARGSVDAAAVSGRRDDEATVLVAATVRFAGAADGGPTTQQFRLRVLLRDEDGTLKTAAVQYLP